MFKHNFITARKDPMTEPFYSFVFMELNDIISKLPSSAISGGLMYSNTELAKTLHGGCISALLENYFKQYFTNIELHKKKTTIAKEHDIVINSQGIRMAIEERAFLKACFKYLSLK